MAVCSMLLSQHYILNKMSLNRNKVKYWSAEENWLEAYGNWTRGLWPGTPALKWSSCLKPSKCWDYGWVLVWLAIYSLYIYIYLSSEKPSPFWNIKQFSHISSTFIIVSWIYVWYLLNRCQYREWSRWYTHWLSCHVQSCFLTIWMWGYRWDETDWPRSATVEADPSFFLLLFCTFEMLNITKLWKK
jgi:hypothetical protein